MPEIISSGEAQNNFGALLDTAQRIPVVIRRHKRDCAVVMSMQEYETYRLLKSQQLKAFAAASGQEAAQRGLTDDKLQILLASPE
jgi:PHD/YefM family antitoxin component YafN of YafNO toxin-antitoxin module